MKVLVVLSALVAFAAAGALTPTELEFLLAFDFDTLYANDEQRNMHFDCLLKNVHCGAYKEVTELSMKLFINQCAECSPAQKAKYDTILKLLHDKYKPVYNELMKKLPAKKE